MTAIDTVHVVFKTHLDIGFTDLASNVVEQYMQQYIPRAIELSGRLASDGGQERFLWTTGSWLIHEYLQRAAPSAKKAMEEAIHAGHIAWHGLPFTTHTELLSPSLFDYGLSISARLDQRFGKVTRAAKMTDVPGHTRSIISPLARRGIRYLHLGVNPASKVPGVPPLFVWQSRSGEEIIVNYADDYGKSSSMRNLNHALVFAHTGDNCGTPTIEEIKRLFADLSRQYPGAEVKASTLDAYAARVWEIKNRLPVVREEIGDTWIHGVATDPKKVAMFRTLLRQRDQWLAEGKFDPESAEYHTFSTNLLLVAEHTWGMDEKKYLADYKHYSLASFTAARALDVVTNEAIPEPYDYLACARTNKSYRQFEQSWQEQRAYLHHALGALDESKRAEAEAALAELLPDAALPAEAGTLEPGRMRKLGMFSASFAADGSIDKLVGPDGNVWADEDHPLGLLTYETFGNESYQTWYAQYLEKRSETGGWADSDFGKPGLEYDMPGHKQARYTPIATSVRLMEEPDASQVFVSLRFNDEVEAAYGTPRHAMLKYRFARRAAKIDVEMQWFDKQANRLPEVFWLSFSPKVANPNLWQMDKLGERVSPLEVVRNGSRNLHAVGSGIYYAGADGKVELLTRDAPLVAPGARKVLQFDNKFASLEGGFHFVLYNNLWGTNFPMWYEEDAKFRFSLDLQAAY